MNDVLLGEIRMFAGSYAPAGWVYCDGSLLPKGDYGALFNLIGTTYGGDGVNNFALPDLRGRVAIGQEQGGGLSQRTIGQCLGAEKVALGIDELTKHNHVLAIGGSGDTDSPQGAFPASPVAAAYFKPSTGVKPSTVAMAGTAVGSTGGGVAHDNMMPSMGLSFIICTQLVAAATA